MEERRGVKKKKKKKKNGDRNYNSSNGNTRTQYRRSRALFQNVLHEHH